MTTRANSRPTKRRLDFQGLPINIEIEAGEVKSGTDDQGVAWAHKYQFPYGEIAGTVGADGDPIDVYLGPDPRAPRAYVVHQQDRDGIYDEDKVMLGFPNAAAAEKAYRDHGPAWGFGSMDDVPLVDFYLASKKAPADLYEDAAARENLGRMRYGR